MLRLASSGVFTDSKNQAEVEALKDLATLKALFEVSGEFDSGHINSAALAR
jgi:hypothetical protein